MKNFNRRQFLKTLSLSLGASSTLLFNSCKKPDKNILPYAKAPDKSDEFEYFSSTDKRAYNVMPVVVKTFYGKPISVNGNPSFANGSSDIFTKSLIFDLYNPDKLRSPKLNGKICTQKDFLDHFELLAKKYKFEKGEGLGFLIEKNTSIITKNFLKKIKENYPLCKIKEKTPIDFNGLQTDNGKIAYPIFNSKNIINKNLVLADFDFMHTHPASLYLTNTWANAGGKKNCNIFSFDTSKSLTSKNANYFDKFSKNDLKKILALFVLNQCKNNQKYINLAKILEKKLGDFSAPNNLISKINNPSFFSTKNKDFQILCLAGNLSANKNVEYILQEDEAFNEDISTCKDLVDLTDTHNFPLAHPFETWDISQTFFGSYAVNSQIIEKLGNVFSQNDILKIFASRPDADEENLVFQTCKSIGIENTKLLLQKGYFENSFDKTCSPKINLEEKLNEINFEKNSISLNYNFLYLNETNPHLLQIKDPVTSLYFKEFKAPNILKNWQVGKINPENYLSKNAQKKWVMIIDTNKCTACSSCVLACQSQNNIPAISKEEIAKYRDLSWINIFKKDDRFFPLMCQHCQNAQCEKVCPAKATVHSSEQINTMVYNRCVGTRYCSNNCPYGVRKFNFFDYSKNESKLFKTKQEFSEEFLKLTKNPDVSVRSGFVMEKCSFCSQKIYEAKNLSKLTNTNIEPVTACQRACPNEAIYFGNIKIENSKIRQVFEKNIKNLYTLRPEKNAISSVLYII